MTIQILRRRSIEAEVSPSRLTAKGRFKLLKYRWFDGQRHLVHETPWFDNLILDSGLNRWGSGAIIAGAAIGTSSTTPNVSQTALGAQTTYTTTTGTGHNTISAAGASPYNNTRTFVYRTALGALNGNYTEVGVGWASGSMFSRALIVDGGGTPTSLSVSSSEQLDIVYQLSVYPPLTDTAHTVTIGGVTYDVVGRASDVNDISGNGSTWHVQAAAAVSLRSITGGVPIVWNGSIGAITGSPSGSGGNDASPTTDAYVNNSYQRTGYYSFSLTQGNAAGGVNCYQVQWQCFCFQYEFDALIPKDSTKTMTLSASVTWARRP